MMKIKIVYLLAAAAFVAACGDDGDTDGPGDDSVLPDASSVSQCQATIAGDVPRVVEI
jgi:hypothetical protein